MVKNIRDLILYILSIILLSMINSRLRHQTYYHSIHEISLELKKWLINKGLSIHNRFEHQPYQLVVITIF